MKKTILVVDDSIFIYEEMRKMVQDTAYSIIGYAKNGAEALKLYQELKPDIVTMDIVMPGITGLETAALLLHDYKDAKVIMVSSLAFDDTIDKAKEIGASGFLYKPIEKEEFLKVLNEVSV